MRDDGRAGGIQKRAADPEEEVGEEELVVDFTESQAEEGGCRDDRARDDDRPGSMPIEPSAGEYREEKDGEAGKRPDPSNL